MGKDLHYSIRPFIERALTDHGNGKGDERYKQLDGGFAYQIKRNFGFSDVIVVLSDAYYFWRFCNWRLNAAFQRAAGAAVLSYCDTRS